MSIIKINSYDPDEVFKRKCNENFSDVNARVASCSGSSSEAVFDEISEAVFDEIYPVGSVIWHREGADDKRLKVGEWKKIGHYHFSTSNPDVYNTAEAYERKA